MALTKEQLVQLEIAERVSSVLSVLGTIFIFVTFISSPNFRRPINRLVFYASWGNLASNIATLMSRSPIRLGSASHLCQFQAFLIQMFVPADAFWNLAMALNVYLTLFRKYNAQQLKALEWRYLIFCYGTTFVIAIGLLVASTPGRGKVYGDAVLWCWIDKEWDFLRVALLYAPAWVSILISMSIYLLAGREIFKKRQELRAFNNAQEVGDVDSWQSSNYKTTDVEITSSEVIATVLPLEQMAQAFLPGMSVLDGEEKTRRGPGGRGLASRPETIRQQSDMNAGAAPQGYEAYEVTIGSTPKHQRPKAATQISGTGPAALTARKNRAAMEANRAAWGYTKVALLFFVSLLVTWVPSSINRVYALAANPAHGTNVGLAFAAGIVLSLMGFWNSVIYIFTSRAACKELFYDIMLKIRGDGRKLGGVGGGVGGVGGAGRVRSSRGVEWERLPVHRDVEDG